MNSDLSKYICNIDAVKMRCPVHKEDIQEFCKFQDCNKRLLCIRCKVGHPHDEAYFENKSQLFLELKSDGATNESLINPTDETVEISQIFKEILNESQILGQLANRNVSSFLRTEARNALNKLIEEAPNQPEIKDNIELSEEIKRYVTPDDLMDANVLEDVLRLRREIEDHLKKITTKGSALVNEFEHTYGQKLSPGTIGFQNVNENLASHPSVGDNSLLNSDSSLLKPPNTSTASNNLSSQRPRSPQIIQGKAAKKIAPNKAERVFDFEALDDDVAPPMKKKKSTSNTSHKSLQNKKTADSKPKFQIIKSSTLSAKNSHLKRIEPNPINRLTDTETFNRVLQLNWKEIIEHSSFNQKLKEMKALEEQVSEGDLPLKTRIAINQKLLTEASKVAMSEKKNVKYTLTTLELLLQQVQNAYPQNDEKLKFRLDLENLIAEFKADEISKIFEQLQLKEQLVGILTNNITAEDFFFKVGAFKNYLHTFQAGLNYQNEIRSEATALGKICSQVLLIRQRSKVIGRLVDSLTKDGALGAAQSSVLWVLITASILHVKKVPLKIWNKLQASSDLPKKVGLISDSTPLYQAFLKEIHQAKFLQSEVNLYRSSHDKRFDSGHLLVFEHLRGLAKRLEKSRISFRKTLNQINEVVRKSQHHNEMFTQFSLRLQNGEKISKAEFDEFEKDVADFDIINRGLNKSIDDIVKKRKQLSKTLQSVKKDALDHEALAKMEKFCNDYKKYLISDPSFENAIQQYHTYMPLYEQYKVLKEIQEKGTPEQIASCENSVSGFEQMYQRSIFEKGIRGIKSFLRRLQNPNMLTKNSSNASNNMQASNVYIIEEEPIEARNSEARTDFPFRPNSTLQPPPKTKIEDSGNHNFSLNRIPTVQNTVPIVINSDSDDANDGEKFNEIQTKKIKVGENDSINVVSASPQRQKPEESEFVNELAKLFQEKGLKSTKSKDEKTAMKLAKLTEEIFKEGTTYQDEGAYVSAVQEFLGEIDNFKSVWKLLEESLDGALLKKLLTLNSQDRSLLEKKFQGLQNKFQGTNATRKDYVYNLLLSKNYARKSARPQP